MAKQKMLWVPNQSEAIKPTVTDKQKEEVNTFFEPLIAKYKKQLQKIKPNTVYNYVTDIYSKWYQLYFYLCEKYKSENPNRIVSQSNKT